MLKKSGIALMTLFALFGLQKAPSKQAEKESKTQELRDRLKQELGPQFEVKEMKEIYLSGPNKTYNACTRS